MEYGGQECSDAELPKAEAELRAKGYHLVRKTNEKDLAVGEYTKNSYSGSVNSFEGEKRWTLRWRIK